VHQTQSLIEVLAGAADVNSTVKVFVNRVVCGVGAGRDQEAGETEQNAGKVHVVLFLESAWGNEG
jgi:hypothetical protein